MTSKNPQPQFGDRVGNAVYIKHPNLNFGHWIDVNTGQLVSVDFNRAYQMATIPTDNAQREKYPLTKISTEFYRFIRNEKENTVVSLYVKMNYDTRETKVSYAICKDINQHTKDVAKYWLHRRMAAGDVVTLSMDKGINNGHPIQEQVTVALLHKNDRTRLDRDVLNSLMGS